MKIRIETTHFSTVKQMEEFLTDMALLLKTFERFSKYREFEFIIETAKLVKQ